MTTKPGFATPLLEATAVVLLSAPAVAWLYADPASAWPMLIGACPVALVLSSASYAREPLAAAPTRPVCESDPRPVGCDSALPVPGAAFHLERARALAKEHLIHD